MSREVFEWFPDVSSQMSQEPKVEVVEFGDGYSVRTPKGLNNTPDIWTMKFTSTRANCLEIIAFLKRHLGSKTFEWTNPHGEFGYYVCPKWSSDQMKGGITSVSVTFKREFEF
jgi:phage-related protein